MTVRMRHPLIVSTTVVISAAAVATLVPVSAGTTAVASAQAEPQIRLTTASRSVTVDRWEGEPGVWLDLGTHVIAGDKAFEIRVKRKSYRDPIVATQVLRTGRTERTKTLPAGLVKDFSGFPGFLNLTVTDATGRKLVNRNETFCPNGNTARIRPDAPDRSRYPWSCPVNPFTLGSVWGIESGWAVDTSGWSSSVDLPDGTYTATVSITPKYRDLFEVPANKAKVKVSVTVRTRSGEGVGAAEGQAEAATTQPQPNRSHPTGRASVPDGPKPDLRSLPAWGIVAFRNDGEWGPTPDGRDYLAFSANVWNAGPSTLVVDGFRRAGQDLMDAYQYFYNSRGQQIGYARTGTLEWDARDGHDHWHFTDFARYRLLDARKQVAVRSQKEAFCLANTDAIDYTMKNANWRPEGTDLHTSCGGRTSLAVREVLDVGSGDTYSQFVPGQSFDISGLPNGTYFIEVTANPDRRLHESNTSNNVSLRKVVLGGSPGERTVAVPPYEGIDAP